MRKIACALLLTISAGSMALAQYSDNYTAILDAVVDASRQNEAALSLADAERDANHTGLNLENPEVEVSYQWGVPSVVPDKKTVDVSQGFDFATLSGAKKRVARARDMVAEQNYRITRRDIRRNVDEIMTDIVWRTKLRNHYAEVLGMFGRMLDNAERLFNEGNISRIDINSIKIEQSTYATEAKLNDIELQNLRATLARMSPQAEKEWSAAEYMVYSLPDKIDFSQWLAQAISESAEIGLAQANIDLAKSELSQARSEGLPGFSVGYTSELVTDANYHGVKVGLELPLWANHGKVRAARAAKNAADLEQESQVDLFMRQQWGNYDKALAMGELLRDATQLRDECDIREAMHKMFEAGELSAHDYLTQLIPLLELDRKVIDATHDYALSLVPLRSI